jgi:hypothetical protein
VNERKPSFAERIRSGEGATSIINEAIDYSVDFEVKAESAIERARRRWRMPEPQRDE